jgi:hypothetical protein
MMYGFMGIWAIEIVEMASRKKLTPQKVVGRTHQAFQNSLQVLAFFSRGLVCVSDNFFWGQFFSGGHFDYFYGSDLHETIHHLKGNWMNFNLVTFLSFYLEGLTINCLLYIQLDNMQDFNSLCEKPVTAVIFHPIGMKFWIQLTKTYLSWTMNPDFLVSLSVEWYLRKSLCKLEKSMSKVHDFSLYHETCSK